MNFKHIRRYENNERLTGLLVAELEWREGPGRTFEIHIDVVPSYQRKGIGRSMIEELIELVQDREPMSLYTFMAADNTQARLFFSAVGFTLFYIPDFYGEGRDAWFGVKPIGTPK